MMADKLADKIGLSKEFKNHKPFSFTDAFNNLYDRLTKDDKTKSKSKGSKTSMLKRNKTKGTA